MLTKFALRELRKVWEQLRKEGSLLGDPEERLMAEGPDGSTPGTGVMRVSLVADHDDKEEES